MWFTILEKVVLFGGLIVAIWQLRLVVKQIHMMTEQVSEQSEWQRMHATFEYLNVYITHLREINYKLQKQMGILKQDGKQQDVETFSKVLEDAETRSAIYHLISYFENLEVGIRNQYFNESIAKSLLHNVVSSSYQSFLPYLMIRESEIGLPVASNFRNLAKRWGTPDAHKKQS